MRSPRPTLQGTHFYKISRLNPPSDPRRAKDADDYLGGQPVPGARRHAKSVARRPHQPDHSAQIAQSQLTQELDSQAFLLATNAERPLTEQGQAAIAKRETTSKTHSDAAKTTAALLLLTRESVAAAADAARVAKLSDVSDTQRLIQSKRKRQDGEYNDVRPQDRREKE